jgi:hypothetical protein
MDTLDDPPETIAPKDATSAMSSPAAIHSTLATAPFPRSYGLDDKPSIRLCSVIDVLAFITSLAMAEIAAVMSTAGGMLALSEVFWFLYSCLIGICYRSNRLEVLFLRRMRSSRSTLQQEPR